MALVLEHGGGYAAVMLNDVTDLPSDLVELRSRLDHFLRDEILPLEVNLAADADPDAELRRRVRRLSDERGFFRLGLPREEGGGGLGPLGMVVVREMIAVSGSRLGRFLLGAGGGMLRNGTEDQRHRFLEPVLRGEMTTAFAFTDAREGPRTTARRDGNAFVLDGVKSFVTGGPQADLLLVVANVTENADGPTGVAIFLVPRAADGVELRRRLHTLDGGEHGEFVFSGCRIPAEDVLGAIGQGLPRAMQTITATRLSLAATAVGTAGWVLSWLLDQVDRPHRTGVPLADREQVQAMIADNATELYGARATLYAAARLTERGAEAEVETAIAKSLATEMVADVVDRAIQLTGGAAVVEGHPLERLYREVRGWRIAEGTTEILRLSIARGLLARHRAPGADGSA
ncbi:MAG: acyl-CoA dehydrogenase family protein [Dehalococcoidia bacterium]